MCGIWKVATWQPTLKRICGCWSLENQWCSRPLLPSMCMLALNDVCRSSWWWGIRLCASILINMAARVSILQSYILYISFPGCAGNSFNPNMLHNPHISKWQLVGKNPCMGCWKIRTYVMLLQIPSRSTCFFTPSECWISLEKATLHSLYSLLHVLKISFKKTSSSS